MAENRRPAVVRCTGVDTRKQPVKQQVRNDYTRRFLPRLLFYIHAYANLQVQVCTLCCSVQHRMSITVKLYVALVIYGRFAPGRSPKSYFRVSEPTVITLELRYWSIVCRAAENWKS